MPGSTFEGGLGCVRCDQKGVAFIHLYYGPGGPNAEKRYGGASWCLPCAKAVLSEKEFWATVPFMEVGTE